MNLGALKRLLQLGGLRELGGSQLLELSPQQAQSIRPQAPMNLGQAQGAALRGAFAPGSQIGGLQVLSNPGLAVGHNFGMQPSQSSPWSGSPQFMQGQSPYQNPYNVRF